MDHVLAKVKGKGENKFFRLLSDTALFDVSVIDLEMCVDYSPGHNLDGDSWFKISQFSSKKYFIKFLEKTFIAMEYTELDKDQFSDISYICGIQGENYCFQKVTPSLFVTRKMIALGEVAKLENNERRLVVNRDPDAIYFKHSDTLVFRNLATISSIFKGIDELYKEATDEEVEKFLAAPLISQVGAISKAKVSKLNRKRIALVMDTLQNMSEESRNLMLSYVESYCADSLKIDKASKAVTISTDSELKLLIYGLEQRFYTTPFGNEMRVANSVQSIKLKAKSAPTSGHAEQGNLAASLPSDQSGPQASDAFTQNAPDSEPLPL